MPKNTIPQAWVKNVYSLCVERVVNRAYSYTAYVYKSANPQNLRVQPSFFTHILDSFTPIVYTPIFASLPQVNTDFCTVSTVPTIKKMKKK